MAADGMWPDDRRVRIAVQRVRLGGREYRVITPARSLKNTSLRQEDGWFDFTVDRLEGRLVGALWLLAARSRRSVVYLPTRAVPCPPDLAYDGMPVDLVLSHHSLQLRPSQWKPIRQRISRANAPRELRTARLPASDVLTDDDIDFHALHNADDKDLLRQHVYGETLFMTGSTAVFRRQARHFFEVARTGPQAAARGYPYFPGGCNYHYCTGFEHAWNEPDHHRRVHIVYLPTWTR